MEIDFFTLGAQIINFLVLVFLLKLFLYGPIIKTMEAREARIAARLKEGEEEKKDAKREAESYQEKKRELEARREELLAGAREEVETMRKELAEKARLEVGESKARWYEAVERQKELFLIDLRRRAGEQIYRAVSRVLRDLADEDLERHIVNMFIKRLENLKDEEKEAIKKLNQKKESGVVIKSGFEIPEIMRKMVRGSVRDQIGDIKIKFERAPELVCGIELHASNWQISWSLNSYLDSLQEDVSRAFEQMIADKK